ncbi:MAG: pyridoxal phosphate-dependent aminotransferase family protein [Verrucomicrobiota bacterium]|jgi:7-keto-8-aminopelargonate synthetase-like enzyme
MTPTDTFQQINRTFVLWKGRAYSYFGGCDYFRLASHRRVTLALRTGLRKYGLNVAASRRTTGNHVIYEQLEAALADFFDAPAATLVFSGYAACAIAAQALQGGFTRVLMDEKAHSSLREASRQFRCRVEPFPHRDAGGLARLLARGGSRDKPIVLTDGLFSHSGEAAPLAQYLQRLPARGMILVDDAHGAGILGEKGRGAPEYAGVSRERIVQTLSLSKAFGTYGGAILGDRALREKIMRTSSMFAGSTPLPPPLAAAALEALDMVRSQPSLRWRLERNVQQVKSALREQGFPVSAAPTPILAFHPSTPAEAGALRERLLSRKIYPCFIEYPGGPETGYFRFAISSEHTREQLNNLLSALTAD